VRGKEANDVQKADAFLPVLWALPNDEFLNTMSTAGPNDLRSAIAGPIRFVLGTTKCSQLVAIPGQAVSLKTDEANQCSDSHQIALNFATCGLFGSKRVCSVGSEFTSRRFSHRHSVRPRETAVIQSSRRFIRSRRLKRARLRFSHAETKGRCLEARLLRIGSVTRTQRWRLEVGTGSSPRSRGASRAAFRSLVRFGLGGEFREVHRQAGRRVLGRVGFVRAQRRSGVRAD
jgi:hypothetical protein